MRVVYSMTKTNLEEAMQVFLLLLKYSTSYRVFISSVDFIIHVLL